MLRHKLQNITMFCLWTTNYAVRARSKKNVLLKFLGKKRDGAAKEMGC